MAAWLANLLDETRKEFVQAIGDAAARRSNKRRDKIAELLAQAETRARPGPVNEERTSMNHAAFQRTPETDKREKAFLVKYSR